MTRRPPRSTLFPYTRSSDLHSSALLKVLEEPPHSLVIDSTICMAFVLSCIEMSGPRMARVSTGRSEEHTSELQSHSDLVCRLLLEKKKATGMRTRPERHNKL